MNSSCRATHLLLAAGLAVSSVTCGGDNLTRPTPASRGGAVTLIAGPPAKINITRQPPASALDQEVWEPGAQPIVVVKDAGGVAVAGVVVTASIAGGAGTLQGTLTATTRANGTAAFTDLGIAGVGPHTLGFATGSIATTSSSITLNGLPPEAATGKWNLPVAWDIVPLHMHLLPTGKILAWGKVESDGGMGMPRLWDPTSGAPAAAPMVPADTMLFCSGHALMA